MERSFKSEFQVGNSEFTNINTHDVTTICVCIHARVHVREMALQCHISKFSNSMPLEPTEHYLNEQARHLTYFIRHVSTQMEFGN